MENNMENNRILWIVPLHNLVINTTTVKNVVLLTLYAPVWRIRHVLPKFLFQNKKGSSKKFPMSVATMSR